MTPLTSPPGPTPDANDDPYDTYTDAERKQLDADFARSIYEDEDAKDRAEAVEYMEEAANSYAPHDAPDLAAIMQRAQWWQHRLMQGDHADSDAVMYAEEANNDVYALVAELRTARERIAALEAQNAELKEYPLLKVDTSTLTTGDEPPAPKSVLTKAQRELLQRFVDSGGWAPRGNYPINGGRSTAGVLRSLIKRGFISREMNGQLYKITPAGVAALAADATKDVTP